MIKIHNFESKAKLMAALAKQVGAELRVALAEKGSAVLAVPGGKTPAAFFDLLCEEEMAWKNVSVMLTDERFVPETSERSNTGLIKRRLLQKNAKNAQFIPFYYPAEQPEEVLDKIIASVSKMLPLDVCVLGMGADMHTASLFPGADLLEQALSDNAPVVLPMRMSAAPEARITLSAPVLKNAKSIHVLITGKEKLVALTAAIKGLPLSLSPIGCVLYKDAPTNIYYTD